MAAVSRTYKLKNVKKN